MTDEQVSKLVNGIYILWYGERTELVVAAVGRSSEGHVWFAPTNWITVPWFDWSNIERAELITTQRDELEAIIRSDTKGKT